MRAGILALALASAAPGCASPEPYWKSRALDLWDMAPAAVQLNEEYLDCEPQVFLGLAGVRTWVLLAS